MNYDVTTEEKTSASVTGPPTRYSVSPLKDNVRCVGCPYPSVGFICWGPDDTCMKTDVDKLRRSNDGR